MSENADPIIELIKQAPAIVLAIGVMIVPILTFVTQLIMIRKQHKTETKVDAIKAQSNGMLAALEKSAYDRGAADEKTGDAQPKAEAP